MALKEHGIIEGVIPSEGGWHYDQPFRGSTQRIPPRGCAGSARRLVELVKDFRIRNHVDVGNYERDIADAVRARSPLNDRFPGRRPANEPERIKLRPLIERLRDRLVEASQRNPTLLIIDDALQRASVCATCPQNVKWVTGCVPCCDDVISRGQNLRQRPSVPELNEDDEQPKVRACRLHNFYLPAFIFIDRDELGPSDAKAPEFCWMKTESTSPTVDTLEEGDLVRVQKYPTGGMTVSFRCPGCGLNHTLPVEGLPDPWDAEKVDGAKWTWNRSKSSPSLEPSIRCSYDYLDQQPQKICHSYLRGGVIDFCADSTHSLSGQKVPLPPIK
jgi:hypothetical protein